MNTAQFLQSSLGLIAFPCLALVFCQGKRELLAKSWFAAVALQFVLALLLLKVTWFQLLFQSINQGVEVIRLAAESGTSFVFGFLGGGELPYKEDGNANSYVLAFRALPIILIFGALTAVLTYWRVLPWLIKSFSLLFAKTLGIGGAVSLSSTANIFVGMTEAPLFIRNSIRHLSRSELFMVMTLGMSTVASTVLILYVTFLNKIMPNPVTHILTASTISVPAAILISMYIVPYDNKPTPADAEFSHDFHGPIDAITIGALNAMKMMMSIIALLITFIALIFLCNEILSLLPNINGQPLSLERILGWVMAPVCWLMGIPWSEAITAGGIMGLKTIANELLAYIELSNLPKDALSSNSQIIMTYALCGFANFGSLGILIGGLTALAPERRNEINSLGLLSILSGTLATCMTASIIGVITAFN